MTPAVCGLVMLKKLICVIIALLCVFGGTLVPVAAAGESPAVIHEDPLTAVEEFSSIALLRYYAGSLDYIIRLDGPGSEANLAKVPFANVPAPLAAPVDDFAGSGTSFTWALVDLFGLWQQQNEFIRQYRLPEAAVIYRQIAAELPAARSELSRLETGVTATGDYLKIAALPARHELKLAYEAVMAGIAQLWEMLDLLSWPLFDYDLLRELLDGTNLGLTPEEIANLTPEEIAELLKELTPEEIAALLLPTALTLEIDPAAAFVGDEITFWGTLTAGGQPLAGREIVLLYNNASLLTLRTDGSGYYRGTFRLPYVYASPAGVQAVFYPAGSDAGTFLAAVSPLREITVLFYEGYLELQAGHPAYPGKTTVLTGVFDYAAAPPPAARMAGFYLDSELLAETAVVPAFTRELPLDAALAPGRHLVVVSAPADGRYAPVLGSCIVDVTLAATLLDMDLPRVSLIPGSIALSGRAYSVAGPLSGASLTFRTGRAVTQVDTAADGSFRAEIRQGMGFSLLGSQPLTVQVSPLEPWHAPLTAARNLFMINGVTTGLVCLVLPLLAIYLPRRYRKWFGAPAGKNAVRPAVPPLPVVAFQPVGDTRDAVITDNPDNKEARANPVLYWYRVALRFVQKMTRLMMQPHQTLREYARDAGRVLGPAGKYFSELTLIIEKRLYGRQQPAAPEDISRSRQLAEQMTADRPEAEA